MSSPSVRSLEPDLEPLDPADTEPDERHRQPTAPDASSGADAGALRPPDLDTLPVPGITRRRVAFVLAAVVSAWIIVVFARQVSEAAAATGRADEAAVVNAALTADVAALQRELDLVQETAYIGQQARAHGLGTPDEVAFTLAHDAPALPADAPGSATQALGAAQDGSSPLDTWLRLLFGPDAGD